MTEPKWTPGPWRVGIDDDGNPLSGRPCVDAAAEYDCTIVHFAGFVQEYWRSARGDREIHANARLIAAAPELYEALRLHKVYEETPTDRGWTNGPKGKARAAWLAARDAAMAKAEGRAQ